MSGFAEQLSLSAPDQLVAPRRSKKRRHAEAKLPRLTVGPIEAAEMLGVSRDYFDEHIKPELRIIRRGSKTILIPVAELERWVEKSAARCRG